MLFNPVKRRDNGFSNEMLQFALDATFDPASAMGGIAAGHVEDCVYAILVGRYESYVPILERAVKWLDASLESDLILGSNVPMYKRELSHARAIASWLIDDVIDEEHWDLARRSEEGSWRTEDRIWTRHEIVNEGALDDYMAFSFLAGPDHWEAGVEMYEHWVGTQAKFSLAGKPTPRKVAYAILLDATGRQTISQEKLHSAGRAMLRANLEENWLGGGQGIRAATWLKIVHGLAEPDLSPEQTLLRAYEDMPKVQSPF